jgi:site-specific recombinase XerD
MTPLRQRYIEDMQLRDLSEQTQRGYVSAVRQVAAYYGKSPAQISEEELRRYFLYLTNDKQASRSTCSVALCALKFLYEHTLQRNWPTLQLVRPRKEQKLPAILSRAEVGRLLGCLYRAHYRACLSTIYACGLRLREGTRLQVADIDSARMVIHIRNGKGRRDRYVPLPERTLALLRSYWVSHRHPRWLFPGRNRWGPLPEATKPLSARGVELALQAALKDSGIQKQATVHTLRHSWSTHLLEAGVNLRLIQLYLGHRSLRTTAHYTHLTRQAESQVEAVINQLAEELG